MPLLPRSRRGTWLLAGAVWLAACAGLWWALPFAPRAQVADFRGRPELNVEGSRFYSNIGPNPTLDWWSVATGAKGGSWAPPGPILLLQSQWDYAIVADNGDSGAPTLFDLKTGKSVPVPWWNKAAQTQTFATRDPAYLILVQTTDDTKRTVWIDRETATKIADFQQLEALAVAPNGNWLTAESDSNDLVLRAPASQSPLARIPRASRWTGVCFSPQGSIIVLAGKQASLVEAQTGRLLSILPTNLDPIVFDHTGIAATAYRSNQALELKYWDVHTGQLVRQFVIDYRMSRISRAPSFDWPAHGILVDQVRSAEPRSDSPSQLWLQKLPVIGNLFERRSAEFRIVDLQSGGEIARLPLADTSLPLVSADGRTAVVSDPRRDIVTLWDIPPRKSLIVFAASAAFLALPISLMAWRRDRELRGDVRPEHFKSLPDYSRH